MLSELSVTRPMYFPSIKLNLHACVCMCTSMYAYVCVNAIGACEDVSVRICLV